MILSSFSNVRQNRVDISPDYTGGQKEIMGGGCLEAD